MLIKRFFFIKNGFLVLSKLQHNKLNTFRYLLVALLLVLKYPFIEAINEHAVVTIVVESLPKNTPAKDSIFVCGNFNDWSINDERYLLHRRFDGNLAVKVPLNVDTLEYKFSRGDWMNMETDEGNVYLPNRRFYGNEGATIKVQILNWQDFGGPKSISIFVFILSAAIFNCMMLIFFVLRIKNRDHRKTFALIIWTLLCMVIFAGTIVYGLSDFIWKFRLFLVFHLGMLWSGPVLYYLYNTLIAHKKNLNYRHYILPSIFTIFILLRWINLWHPIWLEAEMTNYLLLIDFIIGALGPLCFGGYLVLLLHKSNLTAKGKVEPAGESNYRSVLSGAFHVELKAGKSKTILPEKRLFLRILLVNLMAVLTALLLMILSFVSKKNILEDYYNLILGLASSQIFILFYFSYVHQNIFTASKIIASPFYPEVHYEALADDIKQMMETSKPYTDPNLSLAQFSKMINSKSYIVSKVLNDTYGKSFRDFINEYRVRDFIQAVNGKRDKNQTFLYLAFDVGFNSKSTFNLAFKKVTGLSPSEYFKLHEPEQLR